MLTIYRRHRKNCAHRIKGRRHRHCHCPIWVDGILGGKEMRASLKIRDWQRAQEMVREWEVADKQILPPERTLGYARARSNWKQIWPTLGSRTRSLLTKKRYTRGTRGKCRR